MDISKAVFGCALCLLVNLPIWAADPLDSLALDEKAKMLRKGTVDVPQSAEKLPGMTGAEISITSRGFFSIDFAVQEKRDLTVMLLTQEQKTEVMAGKSPTGDPLLRFDIEGPETAGQTARVNSGKFYLIFLNRDDKPTHIVYRASIRAY